MTRDGDGLTRYPSKRPPASIAVQERLLPAAPRTDPGVRC
jgi:hypothetical protein